MTARWVVVMAMLMCANVGRAQSAGPVVGFQKRRLSAGQHDLDARLSAFALDAGTISSVANGRLLCAVLPPPLTPDTGPGPGWEPNRWANRQVLITTGPGAGLLYTVQGNTEEQLQVAPDPLGDSVVLVGAHFEILPNLEDDFGAQLAAGDGVGVRNAETGAAPMPNRDGGTNGHWTVWKNSEGQWRDREGNPTIWPLWPGQPQRVLPAEERQVVITGRVLWPSEK